MINLLPFGPPETNSEWLETRRSNNPLIDCARCMGRLEREQGKSLSLRTQDIDAVTQRVASMNALIEKIRKYVPIKNSDGNAADTTTTGPIGTSKDDSKSIIAALEAFGVDVDESGIDKNNDPWTTTQGSMNKWIQGLQSNQDTAGTVLQQMSTGAQREVGYYTQFNDLCSSFIKKNSDLNDGIANDIKQ